MEKKMNNKGFSLVELIIVVAIMAVLIGVLAPAYLQYVEKSKKTSDCTAIGSVLDAAEIVAADPAIDWSTETLTVTVNKAAGVSYSGATTATITKLTSIVPTGEAKLAGTWGPATITATKNADGIVAFQISGITKDNIKEISPALAERFE